MRWDLIIAVGVPVVVLALAAWREKPTDWFAENDCDHVIENFRWMPRSLMTKEELRVFGMEESNIN